MAAHSRGVEVVLDPRESVELGDPEGAVARLLDLLAQGGRTLTGLADALRSTHPAVSDDEVAAAVEALDGLRLLEDEMRTGGMVDEYHLRHFQQSRVLPDVLQPRVQRPRHGRAAARIARAHTRRRRPRFQRSAEPMRARRGTPHPRRL